MENTTLHANTTPEEVNLGFQGAIRERFDTLLRERGLKYPDFYKPLGFSKVTACLIRNGKLIPEYAVQIKIAMALGVDTKTIWPEEKKA